MMFSCRLFILALVLGMLSSPVSAIASDLRVAPVIIEPLAGSRTTTVTLTNEETRPVRAQIRVQRWSQENGQDVLSPTKDVVASPPLATLKPNEQYLIRLVRISKTPPKDEESYRILIDEVPNPADLRAGSVDLVLRQSIPAFFSDTPRRAPNVNWNVMQDGSQLWLIGRNTGDRRIRLADLGLTANGISIYLHTGLFGYVLPGAEMRWPITSSTPLPMGTKLDMKAMADTGPMEVALVVTPRT